MVEVKFKIRGDLSPREQLEAILREAFGSEVPSEIEFDYILSPETNEFSGVRMRANIYSGLMMRKVGKKVMVKNGMINLSEVKSKAEQLNAMALESKKMFEEIVKSYEERKKRAEELNNMFKEFGFDVTVLPSIFTDKFRVNMYMEEKDVEKLIKALKEIYKS